MRKGMEENKKTTLSGLLKSWYMVNVGEDTLDVSYFKRYVNKDWTPIIDREKKEVPFGARWGKRETMKYDIDDTDTQMVA